MEVRMVDDSASGLCFHLEVVEVIMLPQVSITR